MSDLVGVILPPPQINATITENAEINVSIIGSGARGADGKSAYQIWLDEGYTGTEQDFLNYLQASSSEYLHDQIAPSSLWVIPHNLYKYPSVTIVDTGGNVVVGDVKYINRNEIIVSFIFEFSGRAYLN